MGSASWQVAFVACVERVRVAHVHSALGELPAPAVVDLRCATDQSPGDLSRELGVTSNVLAPHVHV